jgi:hypothetical protein
MLARRYWCILSVQGFFWVRVPTTNYRFCTPNFGGLVLGYIDASDSKSRRIFQHFSICATVAFFCNSPNSKKRVIEIVTLWLTFSSKNLRQKIAILPENFNLFW